MSCSHLVVSFALTSTEPDQGPRWVCDACGERFVPVSRLRDRSVVDVIADILDEDVSKTRVFLHDNGPDRVAAQIADRLADLMETS